MQMMAGKKKKAANKASPPATDIRRDTPCDQWRLYTSSILRETYIRCTNQHIPHASKEWKNGRIDHRKPEKRAVIPHDDALMPMWRALAGAIRNRNECANKRFKLDFTGVELPEELLQVIFGSLHDKKRYRGTIQKRQSY